MKETIQPDMNFFIPIDFEKSENKKGEKVMKIKGIASTSDQDSEGEILDPIGFDLSRFLKIGYLNYNHLSKSNPEAIVGEPTLAKITPKGELYVEGILYSGHPTSEAIWSMAETLERNGSKRKIGFSIEGRALTRDIVNPKKITSALLTGLAITMTPVNGSTYMDLCKGEQKEDWTEYNDIELIEKSETSKYIYTFESEGKNYGITKSFNVEEIDKCMDTDNTRALIPESVDKKVRVLEPTIKKAIKIGLIPIKWVDRIEKARSHKYLRKEGDKYIYEEPKDHESKKDEKSNIQWKSLLDGSEGSEAKDSFGNEVTIRKYKGVGDFNLWINNKKIDSFKTVKEAQDKAENYLKEVEDKFKSFIGKEVNIYSDIKDKVLDFGNKLDMHRKYNIQVPANPMGYGSDSGPSFVVSRNGEKKIMNPSFGERLKNYTII